MFQFPLLGSGGLAPVKGSGPDADAGGVGLFAGGEGQLAAFSGELQAMLMQMSPQMLQQLEELLAGGMTLPQAAKSLLADAGYGGMGSRFDGLLEEVLPAFDDGAQLDSALQRPVPGGSLTGLGGNLLATAGANLAELDALSAPPMAAAFPISAQNTLANTLPPQLAASLLDMGVPQQVAAKGWDGAIADRVMWMVQGEQQFAKLRLNPPNLGPIEVRVTVHQDQASVSFLAQHAAVREALEAAMPRLREMFDQQSLELVHAEVSDPGTQQGDGTDQTGTGPGAGSDLWGQEAEDADAESGMNAGSRVVDGLVDLFA